MVKKEDKIENINEFLKNASNIFENQNDDLKSEIIEQLYRQLFYIFKNKNESEKLFKNLKEIIFPKDQAKENKKSLKFIKQPFLLYPIIYSYNPKLSIEYIDYFLFSLKLSISEENKSNFTFLSEIFSKIIDCFYNDNQIELDRHLDKEKKEKLYLKLFSFVNNLMKINKKAEQIFGCLLLIELIEKCPLIKEENNLTHLFKSISALLESKIFERKIDILNCLLSLILQVKHNFKSHANVCLFRILDYLTDEDWWKRKLAINIVYSLVFYCKEEILAVKENIIEFLSLLKEDNVTEIREVCLQSLKLLEETIPKSNKEIRKEQNIIEKIKFDNNAKINSKMNNSANSLEKKSNYFKKYANILENANTIESSKKKINNNMENKKEKNKNKTILSKSDFNLYKNLIQNKTKETIILKKNNKNSQYIVRNNNIKKNILNNLLKDSSSIKSLKKNKQNNINEGNLTERNNDTNLNIDKILGNIKDRNYSYTNKNSPENSQEKEMHNLNNSINKKTSKYLTKHSKTKKSTTQLVKKDTNQELRERFYKEKSLLEEIQKQINERKPKKIELSSYINKKNNKSNNEKQNNSFNNKNKNEEKKDEKISLNKRRESDKIKYKESIDIPTININNNENRNCKEKNEIDFNMTFNDNNEENNSNMNYNKILEQLNKMQESQNNLLAMMKELKYTIDLNYINLDKRITKLESYHIKDNEDLNKDNNANNNLLKNKGIIDKIKVEIIKNKFKSGKYNEALIESKENDKFLFELLPLITIENISKLDLLIVEDIISELCTKLPKLNIIKGNNNISAVLSFFNLIIKSKISLKLNTQINLKDTLKLMKVENNLKLSQYDITNIDIIIKSLKI